MLEISAQAGHSCSAGILVISFTRFMKAATSSFFAGTIHCGPDFSSTLGQLFEHLTLRKPLGVNGDCFDAYFATYALASALDTINSFASKPQPRECAHEWTPCCVTYPFLPRRVGGCSVVNIWKCGICPRWG